MKQPESERDNLRGAFEWSLEAATSNTRWYSHIISPLWLTRGRIREGLGWFDAALTGGDGE